MAAALASTSLIKIVRVRDLVAHLGVKRNQLLRLRRLDPSFPAPFRLGTGRNGTIAWYQGEIDEWLINRPRAVLPDKASREIPVHGNAVGSPEASSETSSAI